MSGAVITGGNNGPLAGGSAFVPTPTKTAAYTANPGDFVLVDTTSGAVTVTLPNAPTDQSAVTVMMINQASGNAVTVSTAGGDVINTQGGATTWSMTLQYQRATFQYLRSSGIWYVTSDGLPMTQGKLQGALALANLSADPATPSGAGLLYAKGGLLYSENTQGLVQVICGSQGGITSTTTVANTAAETTLQSMSMPANDAIPGAVYRLVGWGVYGDTGTPTLTFTSRLGGVAGTQLAQVPAITLGSGVTNVPYKYEIWLNFLSATTVQCLIELDLGTSASTDAVSPFVATPTSATTISLTTTKAWVVTVTWSAASASNTISLLGAYSERVA